MPDDTLTQSLIALEQGDASRSKQLFILVYEDLRRLAAHYMKSERSGHTLQPTALVHEAYDRLIDGTAISARGRTHFLAIAAQAMRQILVSHARKHLAIKRGAGRAVTLTTNLEPAGQQDNFDLLALDDALTKLAELDSRQAKVAELRLFAGLSMDEVCAAMDLKKRTTERAWTMARSWLKRELRDSA